MKVISVLIFLLFLFAVLLTNSLLGQGVSTLRGSLRVVVNDSQEKVIPGASCLLTQNRRVVEGSHTDLTGTVVFGGLAAGLYELTVEKSGFATYKNKDIGIEADKPNELVVVLQVSSVSAEVSVENSSENVNTVEAGSSPPAANVLRTTLERLPLATKRVDEAIPLIPGVIRSTTGEISIDGANEPQSSFRVNGLNVADPVSGNFRLNLPIDAVETVQVFRHPFSTEFGQFTGGVTNIETRRGGDKWHFEFNDFLPDFRFRNGSIHGVQDNSPHLNFNGPIIKNRFFLSQTLGYSISKSPVRGLSFPNNETISETQSSFTQLDWTLTPTHSQTFTFGYFPERQSFVGLDFFRPRPVTPNYKQKDFVGTFRDAFVFDNRALLQTSVSYKKFDADVWGQGRGEQNLTPVGETGNYFATQKRKSTRFEFLETYDFPAVKLFYGTHNIKTGFNY